MTELEEIKWFYSRKDLLEAHALVRSGQGLILSDMRVYLLDDMINACQAHVWISCEFLGNKFTEESTIMLD